MEIQDTKGRAVSGFTLTDAKELVGDRIAQTVEWKNNPDLSKLAGTPIRLRFAMLECNLYSWKFND